MKILIEGSPILSRPTGVGQFGISLTRELLRQAPKDTFALIGFSFFTKRYQKPLNSPNLRYRLIRYIPGRIYNALLRIGCAPAIDFLGGTRSDVALFLNFIRFPTLLSKHAITTIQDLCFTLYPEYLEDQRFARFLQRMVPKSLKRSDRIVAISENTKRELVSLYKLDPARITVINPAIEHAVFNPQPAGPVARVKERYKIERSYLLYLGSLEPCKNIAGLIKAYMALPENLKRQYQLVLAGAMGWQTEAITEALGQAEPGQVIVTGYIEEADKAALYSGATLFVYPSHYEGWGMQLLEAMACGTPVLTARNSALVESGGTAAAYITDSRDIEQLSQTIVNLLKSPSTLKSMRIKGTAHAEQFSWEKSAAKLLKLAQEVNHESRH